LSWLAIGIGKHDSQIGCEYELPEEHFDTDAAILWFGPDARLSRALWPLDHQHLADTERMVDTPLDTEQMNWFVARRPQWYVTARTADDEPLVIEYHLSPEFGFTQAAAWIGSWTPEMAYKSTPLSAEQSNEIEEAFGTFPTPGRYQHVLESTARSD
jgi:hypothetical protein